MNCPKPNCGSSNIQLMSLYWSSLAPGASGKKDVAPPDEAAPSLRGPVLLIVAGVLGIAAGAVLLGVVALVVGGLWGWFAKQLGEDATRRRTEWENKRVCLACSEQWRP